MAQQKQSVLVLTDGEKLSILIGRDGRTVDEIANQFDRDRRTVTRYMAKTKLNPKVIKRACEILGVPESMFDERLNADKLLSELERMSRDIENLNHRVHILEAEKSGLTDAIKILNAPKKEEGN